SWLTAGAIARPTLMQVGQTTHELHHPRAFTDVDEEQAVAAYTVFNPVCHSARISNATCHDVYVILFHPRFSSVTKLAGILLPGVLESVGCLCICNLCFWGSGTCSELVIPSEKLPVDRAGIMKFGVLSLSTVHV